MILFLLGFGCYFYPRPPRGGRLSYDVFNIALVCISIHALREEGDRTIPATSTNQNIFLSTPSARRATTVQQLDQGRYRISIHALREEGDTCTVLSEMVTPYFYPRPPRGGRQQKQRENPLLLSHYTPLCTNCKEVPVKQTAKSHRYLCKRLVFRCEASRKTMCAAGSHWRGIKRSAHYPVQTPGAAQHARP